MLVSMRELLADAEKNNYAVGGFNCPTLENVYGVIQAAEKEQLPVILSFPQVHEKTVPLKVIGPILLQAARDAKVPVCVHLDHGSTVAYVEEALRLGFNSVMYDGSKLSLAENIRNTQAVVKLAKKYQADVEAELGGIAGDEAGISSGDTESKLTDVDEAVEFVQATGVNSLAASIGTAHGFYTEAPKIDFRRIEEIHRKTGLPLVMHGGSGVSDEDYHKAINLGIRKVNYYSYMAKAGVEGVKALLAVKNVKYFHELAIAAKDAMAEDVAKALRLFANK
mgnify:FL=1